MKKLIITKGLKMPLNELKDEKSLKILQQRAELLSKIKSNETKQSTATLLVFDVGSTEKFGIEFTAIEKVIEQEKITPMPNVNKLFSGLLYYDSQVWPVIKGSLLFTKSTDAIFNEHIILLKLHDTKIAIQINKILNQVLYSGEEHLVRMPNNENNFINGIYHSDISLININAIFEYINTIEI